MDINVTTLSAIQAAELHAQLSTAVLERVQATTRDAGEAVLELLEAVEQVAGQLDVLA